MAQKTADTSKTQAPGNVGTEKAARRHPTELLLESKALSGFQPDFARAVLTEPEYTVEEALTALNHFFKGGGK